MELNTQEILRLLPHRYPFLMIDRIVELEPGSYAVGQKDVSFNEPFFFGRFPSKPIMPEVLIIESIAQVGAVLLLTDNKVEGEVPALMSIQRAHFLQPVVPGDVLTLRVEILRLRGKVGWAKGEAWVGDNAVCEMNFSFSFLAIEVG